MTLQFSLPAYISIGPALALLGRVIHYRAVTRYLRERNVSVVGKSSIRDWNELAAYKQARVSNHELLAWWYVLWVIQAILFIYILGWVAFAAGALKFVAPSRFIDNAPDQAGYTTVFDVAKSGYRHWSFALFGLIFVTIGFALPTLVRLDIIRDSRVWAQKFFSYAFIVGGTLWTAATFASTLVQYRQAVDALQTGQARITEGNVEHFAQVPTKGESFDVNGVKFWYSDNVIIAGFNHTAYLGGPMHEGLPVRIWYWHGQILRLQIRSS